MAGKPRPRCTAIAKTTGDQCRAKAEPGGFVCGIHGGDAPQVMSAAEKRAALAMVQRIAARVGVVVDPEDPYEGAAAAMRQARSIAQRLGERVESLDDEDLRYEHDKSGEQARTELVAYQRAVTDLGSLSIAAIKAGLDEQLVELVKARSIVITAVVLAVLDALQLDAERRQVALDAADAELGRQAVMLGA